MSAALDWQELSFAVGATVKPALRVAIANSDHA